MAQKVECLLCKGEALVQTPVSPKKKTESEFLNINHLLNATTSKCRQYFPLMHVLEN
jgi:hypothetical protein